MITQLVLDGAEIKTILDNLANSIVTVLLSILSGIFNVFLQFFVDLILGTFFDNPAVILIGLIFSITAWRIHISD